MSGSFNQCNVINLASKITLIEDYDDINKIVLYGIIDYMDSLVQTGKYGEIIKTNTKTIEYYVINCASD